MSSEVTEIKKPGSLFNLATQILLPALTIIGFTLTSLKIPEWGLVFNLVAQIFWMYASWKAWKEAGQIGILITTFFITIVVIFGVVNYWVL